MTDTDHLEDPTTNAEAMPGYRFRDRLRALATGSPVPVYVGIGVCMAGFVLIAVTWAQVAPETDVALQLPYIVSAGFTGVALVMVGLTVVSVAARLRDTAIREEQNRLLTAALHEVAQAVAVRPRAGRSK